MKEKENKICLPLLILQLDRTIDCHCIGKDCAWYVPPVLAPNGARITDGHCAIRDLGTLPELMRGVRHL